jgi:hypothetical protein
VRSGWGASRGYAPLAWRPANAALGRLRRLLLAATTRPAEADWFAMPAIVRDLVPESTRCVVGYGSWYVHGLRKARSFPDVYLVVDDYRAFHHPRRFHAWMNRLLPPNVYFVWTDGDGHRRIRGKYNVISTTDVERECGPGLRDVYNAGRLTKLVWLGWARDDATRDWLVEQLVRAHCTLAPLALSPLPEHFGDEEFSLALLAVSFRGEARLEGWDRVRALRGAHPAEYAELHRALLEAFGDVTGLIEAIPGGARKRRDQRWDAIAAVTRRVIRHSRRRGYLRWPRIVLTEPNLVDLAADEAERKVGVRIRVTPRLRRHPLLHGLPEFLRVLHERRASERIH